MSQQCWKPPSIKSAMHAPLIQPPPKKKLHLEPPEMTAEYSLQFKQYGVNADDNNIFFSFQWYSLKYL